MEFTAQFEWHDSERVWVASCDKLRITLEQASFDALVSRMKVAIQEIAEVELGYSDNIKLIIITQDRVEEIEAVS